jgi:hypothetical protein
MEDECGTVGGSVDRGNQSTPRKLDPVVFCAPHLPRHLSLARTWTAAVGGMAQCVTVFTSFHCKDCIRAASLQWVYLCGRNAAGASTVEL